jgi:hypothetical protein
MLAGRDIEVDCRRRLGVRSFSSLLPPDLGLRTSFGPSPETTAGNDRLPMLMLHQTEAQQEVRPIIGQLSENVGGLRGSEQRLRECL